MAMLHFVLSIHLYHATVGIEGDVSVFVSIFLLDAVEDAEQLLYRVGAEHGNAGVAEVGKSLEKWGSSQMATYVQDAPVFVQSGHALENLLAEYVHLPRKGGWGKLFARLQIVRHFLENPRTAEAGAAYHDGIHSIAVETLLGALGSGDIAIADDGNVHTRIVLHFADECPVGFAGVHLATRAAMDGQCLNAAILKLFGKVNDDAVVVVPPETCLHRHGDIH